MVDSERYARQVLLPQIGSQGQLKMRESFVVLVGCGALGTVIADGLVRAGVGRVRIVDRDVVELSNLQRQILFDETDVAHGLPKAVAAAERLARTNSTVEVEAVVADVTPSNVERVIDGADLVMDGTDNFETRYLINDVCVKHELPWVYGGVVGTYGVTTTILPHKTPCFRCLLAEMPAPGSVPTCDTVGVLGAAVNVVASLEVVQAVKLLTGQLELSPPLIILDVWENSWEVVPLEKGPGQCPACDRGQFDFLRSREGHRVVELCGSDAYQFNPRSKTAPSLEGLAHRLGQVGEVLQNEYLVRLRIAPYELTVFADGRALVRGAGDTVEARGIYAKYVGS